MKATKNSKIKKYKILAIIFLVLIIVSAMIYLYIQFNRNKILWKQAVQIMDTVFELDIEGWDFDYEYENTLKLFERKGHIRILFTTTHEHAEQILAMHNGRWIYNDELSDSDRRLVSNYLNIIPEEVNGKTIMRGHGLIRKVPFDGRMTLSLTDCIHIQENMDGTVTVLIYYTEG